MMASFLSHQQHHVQNVMVEVGKEAEEASRALEHLNQALEMNNSKIQQLMAELEATKRATSKYSASLPHAMRTKARTDERLRELKETAHRVSKELEAEKLVHAYLEELRRDDEDSEMKLKRYLNEVMRRDAEGYGDSDSETEWSMLESSVESLKKPLEVKAQPASISSVSVPLSPKQVDHLDSMDESEVIEEPVPAEVCSLPAPTPRSPSPVPEPTLPSSPPSPAPEDVVAKASIVETSPESQLPIAASVPEVTQDQVETPDVKRAETPVAINDPEGTSIASPSEEGAVSEQSGEIAAATPTETSNPEDCSAVDDTGVTQKADEDGDEAEDEESDEDEDATSDEDEGVQSKDNADLAASIHEAAVLSTVRSVVPPHAEFKVVSPQQPLRSPPPISPPKAAVLSPRSSAPLPIPPPMITALPTSSTTIINSPPLRKPTPVRYPGMGATSPPPMSDRQRHDMPSHSGGASLYEHAKRVTSRSSRSADYGNMSSSIHVYPPPFPIHAPDAHSTIPTMDASTSGASRDSHPMDGRMSPQSKMADLQRRMAAIRELRHGSVPMPPNPASSRTSDQDPIGKPRHSRDLPPTPSARTTYPRGDYLPSSSGASAAEIFSYYTTGGTPPLKTIKKNTLGLHEDRSSLYMA